MTPLEQLGRRIAEEQDAGLRDGDALSQARARLLEGSAPRRRTWLLAVAAGVIALALVIGWALRRGEPESIAFDVGRSGEHGAVERWMTVPDDEELPLRFSDGTSVLLRGGARAQVNELTPHGARVTIERGAAAVSVAPRPGAAWRFGVGPFEVLVTGTRFDVSWDPEDEVFVIVMHQGSVQVGGPTLPDMQPVVAGEKLRVDATSAAPPRASASAAARDTAPTASAKAQALGGRWKALAAEGKYKQAYALVEELGFDTVVASASATDLVVLADLARYAGKTQRARDTYTAVRERFPGSSQAALSAFALGRMAFHGGARDGAVRWFRTYLAEAPGGPLAREALGLILEAQHQKSDASARATAEQYLARYPNGPHAELARKILGP